MRGYPSARKILKILRRGCIALEKKRIEKGEMQAPFPYMVFPAAVTPTETQQVKKEPEGIELTHVTTSGLFNISITQEIEKRDIQSIDITYNLIPRSPKKGEKVFAYAHIHWDKNRGELIYDVVEPPLSQRDKELIEKLKRELEERLDVNFYKIGVIKAKDLLREEVLKILSEEGGLSDEQKEVILYYIERDIIGLGKIEPLMNDPNIEDISCDGVNIPIYIYHRDTRIGSVKTNVIFEDGEELNTFVIKLAQKCRKTINIAEPLLDAALPDGSRVQATLGTDIARKGSNFTIRKFTEEPLTPIHMLKYGTLDSTQLAYLWLAVENGQSILISGGTATGKTSLLNALSLFIKPTLKVVSIEDTPELRLPHPHWIPEVARTPLSEKKKHGEVTLFDLLKSSLRQRPDYIVMGEVRGKEAFVLFQQMATGHPSLATMHAASISQLIDRLTTPPISLPPTLLENINIIVFLVMSRIGEKYVRRADTIIEILGIEKDRPVTKEVFKWDASRDKFGIVGRSTVLRNIALRLGMDEKGIKQELIRRKLVLEWMLIEGITDYVEFAKIVSRYYSNPQSILNLIKNKYPFLAL